MRGRVVTLGPSIDAILQRHDFPAPVKRLVGEAAVLASLLATSLKDVGRFILQTQTDGPVSLVVVDVRTPGQIRATATFDAERGRGGDRRRRLGHERAARLRHARHDGRAGADAAALPGLRAARGRDARGGGAHLFPPVGADPDAHPPRRRGDVRPRRGRRRAADLARRRHHRPVPAGGGRARPPSRPAGRRRAGGARSSRRSRRTTTPGSRRRR